MQERGSVFYVAGSFAVQGISIRNELVSKYMYRKGGSFGCLFFCTKIKMNV